MTAPCFYLGTHQIAWLGRTDVPLFISGASLRGRRTYPKALGRWAKDSSGFTQLTIHGGWTFGPREYLDNTEREIEGIGTPDLVAIQDWMCDLHRNGRWLQPLTRHVAHPTTEPTTADVPLVVLGANRLPDRATDRAQPTDRGALVTSTDHICSQCGLRWTDAPILHAAPCPGFCTPECADAWYDAHPDAKLRDNWLTRQDLVDRILVQRGLIPMPRATPTRGDN